MSNKEYCKQYYKDNHDQLCAYNKQYYRDNREYFSAYRDKLRSQNYWVKYYANKKLLKKEEEEKKLKIRMEQLRN